MGEKLHKNIKVLVVDDSAFMRKVIRDILNSDSEIEVIDTAKDGVEAIEKAIKLKPDVITLDVQMPNMDGLTCLKEILKVQYIPVVMVSANTNGGTDYTIRALENGAVEFITKPDNIFDMNCEEKRAEVIEKVKIAKKSTPTNKKRISNLHIRHKSDIVMSKEIKKIIAIGTSTGGPKALQEVIPLIPGNIPAAILVVQHMPSGFTKSLAERLDSMSEVIVKEAEDGEYLKPGYAYIAPGDYHMLVALEHNKNLRICLTKDPPVGGHRPSVDVMMESLSNTGLRNLIGVIMTGMGGDGSEGIKLMKSINKGYIIAQDESSSVVYGMPKVALQTGAVDVVVPLKNISVEIMKNVGVRD